MSPIELLRNRLFFIIFCLIFVAGCSSFGNIASREIIPSKPAILPTGNGWWYAQFRLNWPPDTEPAWHMDLYLAHQIILPVLQANQSDILLWRFHRRAARDRAGRQFSFIFYSSPQAARHIIQSFRSNPRLDRMKSAGVIVEAEYDNPSKITRPEIEDTSDKNWPVSIQKSWPYFIMGTSQMWLNLVARVADDDLKSNPPSSLKEIDTYYRQVNETVTELWRRKGRHAFMHHLNAMFGYEPLIYWEERYMTF